MKKKVYLLFAIIGLGVATLCGCSDKRSSIIDACEQKNFTKAHLLLDKYNPESYKEMQELFELRSLVFEKETDYLIDQDDENASKKIIVLIQDNIGETGSISDSPIKTACASLMTKAKAMKNTYLIKELVKTYFFDSYFNKGDSFFYEESMNFLCEEDVTSAKDLLIEEFSNINDLYLQWLEWPREAMSRKIYEKVFNASIKTGNWSIAKELIDHLDNLKKTDPQGYKSERESYDNFLTTLKTSYSIAQKTGNPEDYQE